jgi:hypothetical protein
MSGVDVGHAARTGSLSAPTPGFHWPYPVNLLLVYGGDLFIRSDSARLMNSHLSSKLNKGNCESQEGCDEQNGNANLMLNVQEGAYK